MPTIMNILGPLTNPARVARQVVGVSDPALLPLIGGALRLIGHRRALIVHGEPGMDEFSPIGITRVLELRDGDLCEWWLDPQADLGWPAHEVADLAGGERDENASTVGAVLRGERRGAARAAVLLNAAAALYIADRVPSFADGIALAESALDQGAGWATLIRLREASLRD